MDLPEASRCWVNYFLSRWETSLIIDGKVIEPRRIGLDIPQGSPISLLLLLVYTGSLYNKIRKNDNYGIGFIDGTTIYKSGRDIDMSTEILSKVPQICQAWHSGFGYDDKLEFLHAHNPNVEGQKRGSKKADAIRYK